jgi:hypothetical protein
VGKSKTSDKTVQPGYFTTKNPEMTFGRGFDGKLVRTAQSKPAETFIFKDFEKSCGLCVLSYGIPPLVP